MKIKLIVTAFLLISKMGFSQWKWQNPLPTGAILNALDFVSVNEGWIVGEGGTILHTSNGGTSWSLQNSQTCESLNAIHFADAQQGWIVGNGGAILHTSDGGANWSLQTSGVTADLLSISFINASEGWVLTSQGVLHTINSGTTWTLQSSAVSGFAIKFTNDSLGWVSSYFGALFHTSNGGNTWISQNSGTSENLLSIAAAPGNDNELWIAGVPGIIHTSNAGATWASQTGNCCKFYKSVSFANDSVGWAIGTNSFVHTTDGGANWITDALPQNPEAVQIITPQIGWLIGQNLLLNSTDAGVTFVDKMTSVTNANLKSVNFADANTGYAVGAFGTIVNTIDSGAVWVLQNSNTASELNAVSAPTPLLAWVAGNMPDTVLHTVDGGNTWVAQQSGTTSSLNALFFIDSLNGWAAGYNQTIIHTSNGGNTWVTQLNAGVNALHSIYFTDENNGWVVGDSGIVLHTSDAGANWTNQNTGLTLQFTSVHFISPTEGWLAGDVQTIMHTINGGNTWTQVPGIGGEQFGISSVFFINQDTGWVAAFAPSLAYTTNGGLNWNLTECDFFTSPNAIYFRDANTGWLVGNDGTIMSSGSAGLLPSAINELSVKNSPLSIVYPNPFTYETKIVYSLLKTERVQLQLFDMSGRCIETLVNELKPAGTNETIIRKNALSAGLYFYKLQWDNQCEIRKLIIQ